jgi:lipopolysaccharide/colanic/teichoic acid biosynthesis glycosyltransferase
VTKRLFDILFSLAALALASPLMLLAAAGIRLSSPGPILYRATRVGRGGAPFVMRKFRTMESGAGGGAITAARDLRVFPFGAFLRRFKIDELPQLFDVLRGDMSIVGPRPEDPRIVAKYYSAAQRETLTARPGLASPGSLYNYTHGDRCLDDPEPERAYAERLLPVKLALDTVYVRRAGLLYDLRIIARTAAVILMMACGRRRFPDPPEMSSGLALLGSQ